MKKKRKKVDCRLGCNLAVASCVWKKTTVFKNVYLNADVDVGIYNSRFCDQVSLARFTSFLRSGFWDSLQALYP